jgi:prophage maintenance system killer protein
MDFSPTDISRDLAAKAHELAVDPREKGEKHLVSDAEIDVLLEIAAADGRITHAERVFIESLRQDGNAKDIAKASFDPSKLSFDGNPLHLADPTAKDHKALEAKVASRQVAVTTEQIAVWKSQGNVAALADVLDDPKAQALAGEIVTALASGPVGLAALYNTTAAKGGHLDQVVALAKGSDPELQAAAVALLQTLAAGSGKVAKLAGAELQALGDVSGVAAQTLVHNADLAIAIAKQDHDSLRRSATAVHDTAAEIVQGHRPARQRLDDMAGAVKGYRDMGARIASRIKQLDGTIAVLEKALATTAGPAADQLKERLQALKDRRLAMVLTQGDFVMDQAAAAAAFADDGHFAGYSAGMNRQLRTAFLAQAGSDLKAYTETLQGIAGAMSTELISLPADDPARSGIQRRLAAVSARLQTVTASGSGVAAAATQYQVDIGHALKISAKRLAMLSELNGTIKTLAAEISPKLLADALSADPKVAKAAQDKLDAIRDQMVAEIGKLVAKDGPFAKVGGTNGLRQALTLIQKELAGYDFTKIAEIRSFEQQVGDLKANVLTAFDKLRKSGDVPRSEVEAAFGVQETVDAAINKADLAAAKATAQVNDTLSAWSQQAMTGAYGAHMMADQYFENPEWWEPITKQIDTGTKDLTKSLKDVRSAYIDAQVLASPGDPDARKKAADSPEVRVMDLLAKRLSEFEQGYADKGTLEKLDAEIRTELARIPADSPRRDAVVGLVQATLVFCEEARYLSRVVGAFGGEEGGYEAAARFEARDEAIAKAKADPSHVYIVIDNGWTDHGSNAMGRDDVHMHAGFKVVQYSLAQYADKLAQANGSSHLLFVVKADATAPDGITGGGVLPTKGTGDPNFKPNSAIAEMPLAYDPSKYDPKKTDILGDNTTVPDWDKLHDPRTDEVLKVVGTKARALVLKQYDATMAQYKKMLLDPDAMMQGLLDNIAGKSPDEVKTFLKDFYGVDADTFLAGAFDGAGAGAGAEPTGTLDAYVKNLLDLAGKYKAKMDRKPPDEKGAKALFAGQTTSREFGILRKGAQSQSDLLHEAYRDVQKMSDRSAAMSLLAKFPSVREQVYADLGFATDPKLGFPPYPYYSRLAEPFASGKLSIGEFLLLVEGMRKAEDDRGDALTKTFGIAIACIAISLVPGGLAAAGVIAAGTATAASTVFAIGSAVYFGKEGIDAANDFRDEAKANVAAGFWGHQTLEDAEDGVTKAWISAAIQVGMAGISIKVGGWSSKFSLAKRAGIDFAMAMGTTAIDPTTYSGDWKDVIQNFAMNGAITTMGMAAGQMLEGYAQSKAMQRVKMQMHDGHLYVETPGGRKPVEIVAQEGKEFTFQLLDENHAPIKDGTFKMRVEGAELENLTLAKGKEAPPKAPETKKPEAAAAGKTMAPEGPEAPQGKGKTGSPAEVHREGHLAYRAAMGAEMGQHGFDAALGLDKPVGGTKAVDETSFEAVGKDVDVKAAEHDPGARRAWMSVEPGDLAVAREAYQNGLPAVGSEPALPPLPEREVKGPFADDAAKAQAQQQRLNERAEGLEARAKRLEAMGHEQAADVLRAQAVYEGVMAVDPRYRAQALDAAVAAQWQKNPGVASILRDYAIETHQNLAKRGIDPVGLDGTYNAEVHVPAVGPHDLDSVGTWIFQTKTGEAMGKGDPLATFDAMVQTDGKALKEPASTASAREAISALPDLPPELRVPFLREMIDAVRAKDPVQAGLLESFINVHADRLKSEGVTPERLVRQVVGDSVTVETPDALRARRMQEAENATRTAVHNATMSDLATYRDLTLQAIDAAPLTEIPEADRPAFRQALKEKVAAAKSRNEVSTSLVDLLRGSDPNASKAAHGILDTRKGLIQQHVETRVAAWRDEMSAVVSKTGEKAMAGVKATRTAQDKGLAKLPPFTPGADAQGRKPSILWDKIRTKLGLQPKDAPNLRAAQTVDRIRKSGASPAEQHRQLQAEIHDLYGTGKVEDKLTADALTAFHNRTMRGYATSLLARHGTAKPEMTISGIPADPQQAATFLANVDEAGNRLASLVDRKVIDAAGPVHIVLHDEPGFRAFYTNGEIHVGPDTDMATIVHEYGHHLENKAGLPLQDLVHRYMKARLGPDAEYRSIGRESGVEPMANEVTGVSPDPERNFMDPYMSKIYASGDTELISMGLEMMVRDPGALLAQDPDLFAFLTAVMRGDAQAEAMPIGTVGKVETGAAPAPAGPQPAGKPPAAEPKPAGKPVSGPQAKDGGPPAASGSSGTAPAKPPKERVKGFADDFGWDADFQPAKGTVKDYQGGIYVVKDTGADGVVSMTRVGRTLPMDQIPAKHRSAVSGERIEVHGQAYRVMANDGKGLHLLELGDHYATVDALIERPKSEAAKADLAKRWQTIDAEKAGWQEAVGKAGGDPAQVPGYDKMAEGRMGVSATVNKAENPHADVAHLAETNWRAADTKVREWVKSGEPLTTDRILELNRTLGDGLPNNGFAPGEIRTEAIFHGGIDLMYVPPGQVDAAMADFATWFNAANAQVPPNSAIELAADAYQRLVSIHPFNDGNGRTARLVMDWVLEQHGLPPATLTADEANVAVFASDADPQPGSGHQPVTPERAVDMVTRGVERSYEILGIKPAVATAGGK